MTKEQAIAMLKAKRECIELDTSGNAELCDRNCGECKLNYEQGNMGEQKEALGMAIKALEQQSSDCQIFNTKENCFCGATEYECKHCDYKIQKEKSLAFLDGCIAGFKGANKIAKEQLSEDCVSRQAILDEIIKELCIRDESYLLPSEKTIYNVVKNMPPVTPTHGTCKDCKHYYIDEDLRGYHCEKFDYTRFPVYADFYCADWKRREE